jgi:flagellar L-ring protein precursor FlgH
MTRHRWIGFGMIVASSVLSSSGYADSIWDRRDPRSAYLFMDNRARRVGDVLTVIVNETTGATNKEQRKLSKDTAASGKFNFAGKASSVSSKSASASLSADQSSDRSFQGAAEYESNRQLVDGISVVVVDVLPNGNLLIDGSTRRTVSNETRWLRVTGIVRPNDIDIANTIGSQFIAKLNIHYEGGGVESRFTNQGWMGRFTNKIWPY